MKKRIFNTILAGALPLIMCTSIVGCSGSGSGTDKNKDKKSYTFRIGAGHVVENVTWTTAMQEYFVKNVTDKASDAGYEIEWIESYGGSVAKLGEALEAVEGGVLDFTYVNYGFEPSTLKIQNLDFRTPFTCPDSEIVSKSAVELFEEYPKEFSDIFQEYNQTSLGIGVTDNYCIFSSKPINSVKDLNGLKIGGGAGYLYWLENTGAVPVQSSLNDAYTSLQTGVYDATICPLGAAYGMKIHEVAPYIILTDFGAKMAGSLTINNDLLNSLPDDLKSIILEVGAGYSEAEAKITAEKYDQDIESLRSEGAEIIQFTDEAKKEWVDTIPNVVQTAVDEFNEAGYDSVNIFHSYWDKLKENGYEMAVEWDIK